MSPRLSLIFPIFNEAECIAHLWERVQELLNQISGYAAEVIFVDDGSRDRSYELLKAIAITDSRVKLIHFSRNFGHQIAITAGMNLSHGDAVVVMDADLQDPPELVLDMLKMYESGVDVVYAVRRNRLGESWFKKWSAKLFYRLLNRLSSIGIPLDTGDFRLMSRPVVDALKLMNEQDRFVRGLVSWVGFIQKPIYFDRDSRVAGETKYPLRKMIRFALNGIVSFSTVPLRLATWLGFILASIAVAYIVVVLGLWVSGHTFPGYASLMTGILLLGGIQLMTIGILGDYVGRAYMESKRRPLYIVKETVGFD